MKLCRVISDGEYVAFCQSVLAYCFSVYMGNPLGNQTYFFFYHRKAGVSIRLVLNELMSKL